MDATDFITLTKVLVTTFAALYAKFKNWSDSSVAVMLGAFMLACFLWGFESVMPYDGDPWRQFIAAGMPTELLHRGV